MLAILKKEPTASRDRFAELLGDITADGVKYQLARLKRLGRIRRVGPDKGGYWEVLK
jgi:ATP-dependent DNA helicase RecG